MRLHIKVFSWIVIGILLVANTGCQNKHHTSQKSMNDIKQQVESMLSNNARLSHKVEALPKEVEGSLYKGQKKSTSSALPKEESYNLSVQNLEAKKFFR